MNLLWAFSFAPKDDTFTGMNMESYAVVSLFLSLISCSVLRRADYPAS